MAPSHDFRRGLAVYRFVQLATSYWLLATGHYPMPTVRVATAALNTTPIDFAGNLARAVAAIEAARGSGARLVVLPELCLSGYGCEDLHFADDTRERSLAALVELLPHTEGIAAVVGLPLVVERKLYNAVAVIADGRLLGLPLKQHLANDGIHYEARWFNAWPAGKVTQVEVDGQSVPTGDLVLDFGGIGVGIENCRDAWVGDQRLAHRYAKRGVSLVLNPSASHFAFDKQAIRERLAREGAAAVRGACIYVNLLGNESGRAIFDGGSLFAAVSGDEEPEIVHAGERFSMANHTVTVVDLEIEARPGDERVGAAWSLTPPTCVGGSPTPSSGLEPPACRLKLEEFSRVVPLGLLDYLRKSGAKGFALSLSGGADSAACAVLVWLMCRLGIEELGLAGFAKRLPRTPGLSAVENATDAVATLLTTVYQSTRNSSETTRAAAEAVAGAVGAEHHEWSVDDLVDGFVERAAKAMGRELAWSTDDLALQNIQSRARAPGVWILANLKHALLLTTGNRSEASVGYATMDGDTAGGLAPLAGVDKAFLREWLRWMQTTGPQGVGPLPELSVINAQQPTAELRPQSEGQTDEADLMPYAVLDAIERSAIGRLETPDQTLASVAEQFPDVAREQLTEWVTRFWRLWRSSQWKRERMAPGFHLDTHSVDPRTWRRWPILSAERESISSK